MMRTKWMSMLAAIAAFGPLGACGRPSPDNAQVNTDPAATEIESVPADGLAAPANMAEDSESSQSSDNGY